MGGNMQAQRLEMTCAGIHRQISKGFEIRIAGSCAHSLLSEDNHPESMQGKEGTERRGSG